MIRHMHRFHGRSAVSRVRGPVLHGSFVSLRFARTAHEHYRMAVVVSKKVAPHAVTRNRIRRRMFEIVRQSKVFEGQAIDCVWYVSTSDVAHLSAALIEKEVLDLAGKALHRKPRAPHTR